jgi:hypothetical protein
LFYTTISDGTLHFVSLRWTQGFVKFSNAYEFKHVAKCGKLQCASKHSKTMWEMKTFVHKYTIPSSIPLEILKTSLGTQIMLPSQFVHFFRANLMLLELLYNYHGCKNEIYEFWAHKFDCWYFIQILNVQIRIFYIFMIF